MGAKGMLVIQRKLGEKVMVGDKTEIVVLELDSHRVKLGFNAPEEVAIDRFEIWKKIQTEGRTRRKKAS